MLIAAEILVGYFMIALTLFMVANVILPLATIAVSVPAILAAIFVYRKVNTDMEKKKIKGMFSRYTESETVDDLIKAPEIKAVDAKKTKATMLFSDIRGFSEISSQLEPDQVVQLLNKYFDLMTQVLSKYDGTIDRYSGDGIMAVFGLPIPREDDAARAVMAALEMQAVIKNFNALIGMQHRPPLKLGIGINTGEVMVGSVGVDDTSSQYTAIGDAVHIASRMESMTRPLDTDVIISESTFQEVQDKFVPNSLGTHRIKGKHEKMRLYQVLFQRRNGVI
jgi:adenylate cyclase